MRKNWKKRVALLLAAIMTLSLLSACNSASSNTPATKEDTGKQTAENAADNKAGDAKQDQDPVTLKWYGTGNVSNGRAEMVIEKWYEVHPEIKIEYVEVGTSWGENELKNLDVMIAADEEFDVIGGMGHQFLYSRIMNGAAMPLTEAIKNAGDNYVEKFGEVAAAMVSYENDIYAVPINQTSYKVLYNKTVMEEKGITVPEHWTLEEFMEIAKKLTGDDFYGTFYDATWSNLMYAPAQTAGWEMVKRDANGNVVPNFDDPIFRETMEWMYDLTVTSGTCPSYATIKAESLNRRIAFAQGKSAMLVDSEYGFTWLKNYMFDDPGEGALNFEIGVAELPIVNEAAADVQFIQPSACLWIPKTSKHVDEAYMFIKFIAEEIIYSAAPPISTSAKLLDAVVEYTNVYTDKAGKVHENIYPEEVVRYWYSAPYESHLVRYNFDPTIYTYQALAETIFKEQYSAYMTGDMSVDDLIEVLNATCKAEFLNVQ